MIVISIKSGFHFKSGSFSPIPNIEDGDNLGSERLCELPKIFVVI